MPSLGGTIQSKRGYMRADVLFVHPCEGFSPARHAVPGGYTVIFSVRGVNGGCIGSLSSSCHSLLAPTASLRSHPAGFSFSFPPHAVSRRYLRAAHSFGAHSFALFAAPIVSLYVSVCIHACTFCSHDGRLFSFHPTSGVLLRRSVMFVPRNCAVLLFSPLLF